MLPEQLQDTLKLRRVYARKLQLIDLAGFVEDKMKFWNIHHIQELQLVNTLKKKSRSNNRKKINILAAQIE